MADTEDIFADEGYVPPFQKKYFSATTMMRYEPLMNAMEAVEDTAGQDEGVWKEFDMHWEKFMNFTWLSNWSQSKYDIIFYGVNGYSGYLIMEYLKRVTLQTDEGKGMRFAFAASNASKVQEVRDMVFKDTMQENTPIIISTFEDVTSVIEVVKSARVVVNAGGPYMLTEGEVLVDACIWCKTDYVDLSQELPWSRRLKDLHRYAVEAGVICVPGAASNAYVDVGVHLLATTLQRSVGEETRQAVCLCQGSGTSAGISAEMLRTRAALQDAEAKPSEDFKHPFSLGGFIPHFDRNGVKVVDVQMGTGTVTPSVRAEDKDSVLAAIVLDQDLGVWRAPYVHAKLDSRTVRRSNMLQADLANKPYGRKLNFIESVKLPSGVQARSADAGEQFEMSGKTESAEQAQLENEGRVFKDDEGTLGGPTLDQMVASSGYFLAATSENGHKAKCSFIANDGYYESAHIAAEIAMILAFHRNELPFAGGVLTPSAACGAALLDRLKAQIRFSPDSWPESFELSRPGIPS